MCAALGKTNVTKNEPFKSRRKLQGAQSQPSRSSALFIWVTQLVRYLSVGGNLVAKRHSFQQHKFNRTGELK
jgi:hypothetical protein